MTQFIFEVAAVRFGANEEPIEYKLTVELPDARNRKEAEDDLWKLLDGVEANLEIVDVHNKSVKENATMFKNRKLFLQRQIIKQREWIERCENNGVSYADGARGQRIKKADLAYLKSCEDELREGT